VLPGKTSGQSQESAGSDGERSHYRPTSEGSTLRGISRISGLAYETVVSIIHAASQKAQMIHNQELQSEL